MLRLVSSQGISDRLQSRRGLRAGVSVGLGELETNCARQATGRKCIEFTGSVAYRRRPVRPWRPRTSPEPTAHPVLRSGHCGRQRWQRTKDRGHCASCRLLQSHSSQPLPPRDPRHLRSACCRVRRDSRPPLSDRFETNAVVFL